MKGGGVRRYSDERCAFLVERGTDWINYSSASLARLEIDVLSRKRLAVSLVLSRRNRPEELLLVERSKKLRYFPGFLAFPGGTLDAEDDTIRIRGLDDKELSPFIAAGARELFEETGIWLGRGGTTPSEEQLREDRRRLLAEDVAFAALLKRNAQHLDATDLVPLCRITTPPFAPVRYDTWFLRGLVPEDATVEIWDGELVDGDFVDPAATLERWRRGELHIAPPMVVLLDQWSKGQDEFFRRVRELTESYQRGKIHRVYFSPGILLVPLKTPTQPPATHTNTCIVGEERLYVVDSSPIDEGEQGRFWDLLDDLLAEGRKLEGILLTHYHPDHVGALREMQRRYDVAAFAHADCMQELPGARFQSPVEHGASIELGSAPDGSCGWKLSEYHVPGHAGGHLAFQDSRYGAIVVGDLVSTLSSILIDPRDGHLATYLKSLDFLESVTEGTLYPGHGPPVPDGKTVIRKTIEHRAERENQLLGTLATEPQSAASDLHRCSSRDARARGAFAALGLIKLEEEGRVTRSEEGYALV